MKNLSELKKYIKQYLNRRIINYAIVFFSFILGMYLNIPVTTSIVLSGFIWLILNPVPIKKLAYLPLIFIAISLALMVLRRKVASEEFAIYAFYALVLLAAYVINSYFKKSTVNANQNDK